MLLRTPPGFALALLSLIGCGVAEPPHSPDAVAYWQGGELTFEEIEERARLRARNMDPIQDLEGVVSFYGQVSKETAAASLLMKEPGTVGRIEASWQPELEARRRQVLAREYLKQTLREPKVTPEEVEAFYLESSAIYRGTGRRLAYQIFKRGDESEALQFLTQLKQRVRAGESFADLARKYSDSKTRDLGGSLGWIEPGTLPADLEKVVFSLGTDEVSEPVAVAGGAVLFQVTDAEIERVYSLDEVRQQIESELRQRKREAEIDSFLRSQSLPADSVAHRGEALAAALEAAAPTDPVLAIDGWQLTLRRLEELHAEEVSAARGPRRPSILSLYQRLARTQRVYWAAKTGGYPKTEEERETLEAALTLGKLRFLEHKVIEEAIRAEINEQMLADFFEANRELYQSPLQWHLRLVTFAKRQRSEVLAEKLDSLGRQTRLGEIDLEAEVGALGGRVEDMGWVSTESLRELPTEVRSQVLELDTIGVSEIFDLDRRQSFVQIVERRERAPLSIEEAREPAEEDAFRQLGPSLWERRRTELLDEAGFVFDEIKVRKRFQIPTASE